MIITKISNYDDWRWLVTTRNNMFQKFRIHDGWSHDESSKKTTETMKDEYGVAASYTYIETYSGLQFKIVDRERFVLEKMKR